MDRVKDTLLVAFSIAFASLFSIEVFMEGFIITLSVILLPIFFDNYYKLNPLKTAIAAGFISPIFREVIVYLQMGDLKKSLILVAPDMVFYFTYGVIYYFLYYKKEKDYTRFFFTVFICDVFSNFTEIMVRTNFGINDRMIKGLFIIALIRALIVLTITMLLKNYKSFLIREEHEERYRKLMCLASSFKSEIYFMNKNINEIEDITKKAFKAYQIIEEHNYMDELKKLSLDISKDIHEIKKGYLRVIAGLEELSIEQLDASDMDIHDIINILKNDTDEQIRIEKRDIIFTTNTKCNFYVEEHFYLVSVLRNLISNAVEGLEGKNKGKIELNVFQSNDDCILEVRDNGNGIQQSNMAFIFNSGFSTKFDKETGNIGRGVGLTIVRDIIEEIFHGEISFETAEGKGTTFTVKIPMDFLSAAPKM